MASTVLPNGIIVPEKFSRDWYADLYHNWQELDNLLGGGTPKDGTLTIQKNGDTVGTFSANQSTDETVNIEVPDVNDATLTIQQNSVTVDTFTANSSSDKTVDIQCVDLSNNQTVGGNKEFTGTTTAHDLVPSATDTYNFGSPSYQWNNAYIKSLTINGVACGDILTHNASEFVNVSSNQTIGGTKTFTSSPFIKHSSPYLNMVSKGYIKGVAPSSDIAQGVKFYDDETSSSANHVVGGFESLYSTSGYNALTINCRNYTQNNIQLNYTLGLYVPNDNIRSIDFRPSASNIVNLGTSTNKWKSFNGINPGALSLPGASVNVDTTNWVLDGSNVNIFTPTSDGWLGIQVTDTVYDQMHYVFVGRTGGGGTYYPQNLMSPISALWDNTYHGGIFIPVIKDMQYHIRCICNNIVAKFYPCQGNV